MKTFTIRLFPGQNLQDELIEFVRKEKLTSGMDRAPIIGVEPEESIFLMATKIKLVKYLFLKGVKTRFFTITKIFN